CEPERPVLDPRHRFVEAAEPLVQLAPNEYGRLDDAVRDQQLLHYEARARHAEAAAFDLAFDRLAEAHRIGVRDRVATAPLDLARQLVREPGVVGIQERDPGAACGCD